MPSCLTCQSAAGGEERPASRKPAGLSFGSDHSRVLRPVVTSAPTLCRDPALTGHPGVAWGRRQARARRSDAFGSLVLSLCETVARFCVGLFLLVFDDHL